MNDVQHGPKQKTRHTYNAAADHFDEAPLTFWDRAGRGTVARARISPGERVLDVCCGTGASALPAAAAVGPSGSVTGVDLADNLLAIARSKATERGFEHASFRQGDMESLDYSDGAFDAVVCVFGIFFVQDMARQVAELWRMVRPGGGRLAITIWGPRIFEPATSHFWSAVQEERPDLHKGFNPWDRIVEPGPMRKLFQDAGIGEVEIELEETMEPLRGPEDWWKILLGTGYRGTIDALGEGARERVRQASISWVEKRGIREVESNFIYGVATKPA